MRTKYHYIARWYGPDLVNTLGNVSFTADTNANAIKMADKIGREINLPNTYRTLHRNNVVVHVKSI